MRVIHLLSASLAARQQIESLHRLAGVGGATPHVLDFDRSGDTWRLLTTWVEGDSLASYFAAAREGRKPWPTPYLSTRLFNGFVHGLCQFHRYTCCAHGDISPSNVIVQAQPQRLVLIDFGSAWAEDKASRRVAGDGSTPGYAAPEQHTANEAGPLADQFSATVVYYEMLTGQLPYQGMGGRAGMPDAHDKFRSAYASPSRAAADPHALPKRAWKAIDALACRPLSLSPEDRFTNLQDWLDTSRQAQLELDEPLRPTPYSRLAEVLAALLQRGLKR